MAASHEEPYTNKNNKEPPINKYPLLPPSASGGTSIFQININGKKEPALAIKHTKNFHQSFWNVYSQENKPKNTASNIRTIRVFFIF